MIKVDKKLLQFYTVQINKFVKFIEQNFDNIVIYGAGEFGVLISNNFENTQICFVDSDINKCNKYLDGNLVYHVNDLSNINYDLLVVSVLGREEEIIFNLTKNFKVDIKKVLYFDFGYTKEYFEYPFHDYARCNIDYFMIRAILKKRNIENFFAPFFFMYDFNNVLPIEHFERYVEDYYINYDTFSYIIIHNNNDDLSKSKILKEIIEIDYEKIYENGTYILYEKKTSEWKLMSNKNKFLNIGILITTFNRPKFLDRTLVLLEQFDLKNIIVVNDNSDEEYNKEYNEVFNKHKKNITIINNPENRGLAYSLNTGFCYLLADSRIEWISYFQDDITYISEDLFKKLALIQDKDLAPIVTGYYGKEHPIQKEQLEEDITIYDLKSTPGVHIHLHRKYINNILPIPTNKLGAPKPGITSYIDWWIGSWSPNSIIRQDMYIKCIPNLIETDLSNKNSTYRKDD